MRILVVEDDRVAAAVLSKGLREHTYAVDVAEDGSMALEQASINEYDLIVLDVLMPGINGLEVCRRLRAEGIAAPILMLTALGEPDQRVEGLDVGADDYLAKPYHFPELLARVRALLRRGPALTPSVLSFHEGVRAARISSPPAGRGGRPSRHRRARLGRQLRSDVQSHRGLHPAVTP
jgi:DNA-binding response OmpR family regulator